nr:hypothetical protein [Tanacetum cinerariifolium]
MRLKLFPKAGTEHSDTFSINEVLRIQGIFTTLVFPGSDLFGPYELLNFTLVGPYANKTTREIQANIIKKVFTFQEMALATQKFSSSSVVGRRGYGKVYKGILWDGTVVAIKRAEEGLLQGEKEFLTEIELLSRLRHRNLVCLLDTVMRNKNRCWCMSLFLGEHYSQIWRILDLPNEDKRSIGFSQTLSPTTNSLPKLLILDSQGLHHFWMTMESVLTTYSPLLEEHPMDSYPSECIEKFVSLALWCCNDKPHKRPSMSDVVRELEHILEKMPETGSDFSEPESSSFVESSTSPFYSSSDVPGSDLSSGVGIILNLRRCRSYLAPKATKNLKVIQPIKGRQLTSVQGLKQVHLVQERDTKNTQIAIYSGQIRFVLTFVSTSWRHPWDQTLRITLKRMSAMANTTPIVTTVTKPATNPRDTDATPRVNIQDFCYEDILPIIMDKVRRDKRKESPDYKTEKLKVRDRLRYDDRNVLDRLGYRRQSAFDRLSETYSPSTTKSGPGRTNSKDHPRGRSRPCRLDASNEGCLEDRERFRDVGESYDDSYSHSYHDRDRSRHMKRRRGNKSPLSNVSKSDFSDGRYRKSKSKRHKPTDEDDLTRPWMCEEKDPFPPRIRNFESSRRTRIPNNAKTYDGTRDPDDHVKNFQAAAKVKRWAMPTWCHMFNSTLIGAARVWFDELPSESVDSYKDLKASFLAYFMQQKKYVKDPVEIHNIKQKDGKTIEDFIKRFKIETERIKGASECMRISGFMHGVNNPELTKRLNEHVPKTMEEMMITTTAFIRGEAAAARKKKGKEGGLAGSPPYKDTKRNFCGRGRHIEELVRAGKLSHLIKEIKHGRDQSKVEKKETPARDKPAAIYMIQSWQRMTRQKVTQSFERVREITFPPLTTSSEAEGPLVIEAEIGGHMIHRMYVDGGSSMEILYEHCFNRLRPKVKNQMVPATTSLTGFSGETIWPLGKLRLLVTIRRSFYKSMDEFYDSHGMLKFPVDGGIVTIRITILIPTECATVITSYAVPKEVGARPKNFKVALHPDFSDQEVAAEHRLNIRERYLPVWQKKKGHAPEHVKTIQVEVQKLVEAWIMREVYYHDWLSNPVMVKKHDGSWRIYSWQSQMKRKRLFTPAKGCIATQKCLSASRMLAPRTSGRWTKLSTAKLTLFTDGSSCVDGSGTGLILTSPEGTKFTYALRFQFAASNNEAEYEALIAGLRIAAQMGVQNVHVSVDSKLVANQVLGTYVAKEENMIKYLEKVLVEILKEKSIQEKEVTTVVEEDGPTWMTPIIEYLKEGTLPSDRKEARKLRIKARQYELLEGVLYRRSFLTSWLRCIGPLQAKWGIDIAGPFPKGPGKVKFLIVAMDYFMKWIEAKAVATITGSQHSQSNELIERANQSLGEGIKARLGKGNKNWVKELLHVLWAHRTMIKLSHGDTPFSLTYGTKAIIPAEIEMPTYRTAAVDVVYNYEELCLNLDLLEERRKRATICEAKAKLKMTKYYNARDRDITLRPGDFVYRNNDASHAVDGGKLGSKWEGPYEVT